MDRMLDCDLVLEEDEIPEEGKVFFLTLDCKNLPFGMVRRLDGKMYDPVQGVCGVCMPQYHCAIYAEDLYHVPIVDGLVRTYSHLTCSVGGKKCLVPPPRRVYRLFPVARKPTSVVLAEGLFPTRLNSSTNLKPDHPLEDNGEEEEPCVLPSPLLPPCLMGDDPLEFDED